MVALVAVFPPPAKADLATDEDLLFYDMAIEPDFRQFHRQHGRFPESWREANSEFACSASNLPRKQRFPRRDEAVVWKPDTCTLSYKIQYADKHSFRVLALAKGHVVSINDTFRVTYLKTPYHDHGPYECPGPPGTVC